MSRRGGARLLLAVVLVAPTSGAAKPTRACIDAHAEGQVERDAGRLLSAAARFQACAVEACPAMIRKECVALGEAVEAQTPSVVVSAVNELGQPLAGASATIDQTQLVQHLDGAPQSLDPGPHQVRVELPDGRKLAFNFSLAPAEKGRPLTARFEPPKVPAAPRGKGLAYVLGGVGLAGLGGWAGFAWDGRRRQSALDDCAPHCTDRSEVDAMRRSYLIADVLLGVSAAALGTSAYLLIISPGETPGNARSLVIGARGRF